MTVATAHLSALARTAATTTAHWQRFFDALREGLPRLDRICAAVQIDPYTAYLPLVAQPPELDPILGRDGLFADREHSRTFEVIAAGLPHQVGDDEWQHHPDLAFYGVVMRANLKLPVALGGYPTVWNLWSRSPGAFGETDMDPLIALAGELSRSPFILQPLPVGLALRRSKTLTETRARDLAA